MGRLGLAGHGEQLEGGVKSGSADQRRTPTALLSAAWGSRCQTGGLPGRSCGTTPPAASACASTSRSARLAEPPLGTVVSPGASRMRSSLAIELGGGLGAAAAPAGAARAAVAQVGVQGLRTMFQLAPMPKRCRNSPQHAWWPPQAPGMAVLFHGDRVPPPACGPLAVRLQQPAQVAALLQAKFPRHAVVV